MKRHPLFRVFSRSYLTGKGGFVSHIRSTPVAVAGNALVVSATLLNSTNLGTQSSLAVSVEASYDGRAWFVAQADAVEFDAQGVVDKSGSKLSSVDFAFARLAAEIKNVDSSHSALFDASVVFSAQ
ncbi:MAG: hypothetical protein V3W41_17935 [Planctomycetota bacterium]